MAATRADKEAHDPVLAAPAEETILVAQDQLPQARAEDLAKKEEAGDNKMTSDPPPGSDPGPAHRPELMEQLTVPDQQEAVKDQDSMLDPLLDLQHPLDRQDLLESTADHLAMVSRATTTSDHQKQDQATTGHLDLVAILTTDLQDLLTIDPLDLEEIPIIDLMDLEMIPTIDHLDLEEISMKGQEIQTITDQLTLADLLALQIGPLG